MGLSHAMGNLVDDIRSSAESRGVKISEMKSNAHNLLERFHLERQDMISALKEKFSSDRADRMEATQQFMSDVRSFMSDISAECQDMARSLRERLSSDDAARREAIQHLMGGLASDHWEAQEIWRRGSAGMVEEVAPQPAAEEEAVEESVFSSADGVLEVIAKRPEGIRLVDIGNELGVDWRGLIGAVKTLVDENRIDKIDNLYLEL